MLLIGYSVVTSEVYRTHHAAAMWISFSGVLRMRPIDASLQFRYNTVQYAAPKRAALHCTKEVIRMDPVVAGLLAVFVVVVFGLAFWLYSGMRRESRLAQGPPIARLR